MNITDITQKTDAELATMLADNRKQVAQLMLDSRTKQTANVRQLRAVKKTVARVLTVQRERQVQAAAGTQEKEEHRG